MNREQDEREEHHEQTSHSAAILPYHRPLRPAGARAGVMFGRSSRSDTAVARPDQHRRPGLSDPGRTLTAVTTPAARARRFAAETPLGRTRRARRMTRELAEIWPDAV